MSFNNFFKDYFTFTKTERNGIIVLLVIIVVLLLSPNFLELLKNEKKTNFSEFETKIDEFEHSLKKKDGHYYSTAPDINSKFKPLSLFYFDPNNTNDKEWKLLGLNEKQINTINNYISKGGKFYKKQDLKKIYGLSSEQYKVLEPYIRIPDTYNKNDYSLTKNNSNDYFVKNNYKSDNETLRIEINSADTSGFKKLKGIGSVFASRIIKYRVFLGGFVNKNQLLEVYGINEETFKNIEQYLLVDTLKVYKININTDTFEQINKHPYISYSDTKALVNYRNVMGKFSSVKDILTYKLIPQESYDKVKQYLIVE